STANYSTHTSETAHTTGTPKHTHTEQLPLGSPATIPRHAKTRELRTPNHPANHREQKPSATPYLDAAAPQHRPHPTGHTTPTAAKPRSTHAQPHAAPPEHHPQAPQPPPTPPPAQSTNTPSSSTCGQEAPTKPCSTTPHLPGDAAGNPSPDSCQIGRAHV